MLSIKQIKAAGFAVVNHYRGWQLLRNPKGVSGTTVKMIKADSKIDERTLDITNSTSRMIIDFSAKKPALTKNNLESIRFNFYNSNNEKVGTKKQLTYTIIAPEYYIPEVYQKSKISLPKRQLESLHIPNIERIEYYSVPNYNQLDSINQHLINLPILVKRSFAHIEAEKFNNSKAKQGSAMPFWRTLWHNLRQA